MRHTSHVVERLMLDGRDLPLEHGTVVIVARDSGQLDWEVVAQTIELEPVARTRHEVALRVLDGVDESGRLVFRTLTGPAVFVRAVDRTVVLRGDGELDGVDRDQLVE